MASDWAADVRKYAPNADDAIIAAIIRYCGVALNSRDSALVAFSDKEELGRVRDSFLKKKLGLKLADDALDTAIAEVGKRLKGVRNRNRVTVYYLLAEQLDRLSAFAPKTKAAPTKKAAPAKAATLKAPAKSKATAKAKAPVKLKAAPAPQPAPIASLKTAEPVPPAPAAATPAPQTQAAATPPAAAATRSAEGLSWWAYVLIVAAAALVWWLFLR